MGIFAVMDPNLTVGIYAVIGMAGFLFWRLIVWVRDAPAKPDPWDAEVAQQLQEAQETCPNCSTPQSPTAWFCPHCGRAVGPYNNMMPFVQIFSEGEVFRNGTSGRFRNRRMVLIGYILISLGMFSVFAPIFWISLLRNFRRSAGTEQPTPDQNCQ